MRKTHRILMNLTWLRLLILLAAPAYASTNAYDGTLWSLKDTRPILAASAEITAAKYPDCDMATVEQGMMRVYHPDGTGESQDETFVKVLTEKGRRANRTLSLSFTLPYSTVDVVKLEVFKPDGTVQPVDVAANSKESINDSQMAMNIYDPNERVLQVNLPKVEIGDLVHSVIRQTTMRPYIPGQFSEQNVFEGCGFIQHASYEVQAPAGHPLKCFRLRDEISGTTRTDVRTNAAGDVTYHWEIANVPRMFDEPSMPPYEMVLQRLLVSTLPDWPAVSQWYWELSRPHLETLTPEMTNTVQTLTAKAVTDLEKIKAVFYHVSKNIRYMGLTPEKDRPGFEPHDVRLTFEKKYGVCRDKAALLVSLLRVAGLKAYPVLINVGCKLDPEVPSPDFNHAIAGVELSPDHYLLMDPTDENTRELLPSYDCDRSYLVCKPEGDGLRTSPVQPAEENLMRVRTTATLSAAGALEAKSELLFEGVNDDIYRNGFVKMKPDDLRRFFEGNLKQVVPSARLKAIRLQPENLLDMSSCIRVELEYSAEGLTVSGQDKSVVTVPWIGKNLGMVNFVFRNTGLEKRKYPLQTGVTCGLKETVEIRLGEGFAGAASLPTCTSEDDECLTRHEDFSLTNGVLQCSRELQMKAMTFSPAQYAQLKQALKDLQYDGRKSPVMAMAKHTLDKSSIQSMSPAAPVEVNSDAKILNVRKELKIADAHAAVYRVKYSKEILSYSGKKRESELKLEYNPSLQQARLVAASVTSKAGVREAISPGEINLMDAAWNASAKRYTGGKVLVANLPGVEIGSILDVEFEIAMTNKCFFDGFEAFQLPDELVGKSFLLTLPENLKLQTLTSGSGEVHEVRNAADSRRSVEWRAGQVKAQLEENQLPPDWLYNSGVGYFVGDAKAYYRQLNAVLLDRASKGSQAALLARQLTASATNRFGALLAIRDFIAKSIRIAGPSFMELPMAELSAADTTLSDGYGHLADSAILFHAMLTAAGFKPQFVLASELPPLPEIRRALKTLPMPHYFGAPLIRVCLGGETYYFNDTDQYSQPGSTAHDGKLGILLASQDSITIQSAKACRTETQIFYRVSLSNDGRARIDVKRSFYGGDYNAKKRYFAELPPEERRRYFQQLVADVSQGARPVADLATGFDTYPGTASFAVEVDNYAVVDGKYFYFDLPFTASLFPARADTRVLPWYLSDGSRSTVSAEVELPPGFQRMVIAPRRKTLTATAGVARISAVQKAEGKWLFADQLESKPSLVNPRDYSALLHMESELRQKTGRLLLLEKN